MALFRIRTGKNVYLDNNSDQWVILVYTLQGASIQLTHDPADATVFDSYNLAFQVLMKHQVNLKQFSRIETA